MTEFNSVFQYLVKEGIGINKSEFAFQLQSHPDYPNLLAIVDTLHFFDVSAGAFRITQEEYHLLPTHFLTFLYSEEGAELVLVEKMESGYSYYKGKKKLKIAEQELSNKTNGVFLLVENENKETPKNQLGILKWIPLVLLVSLLSIQVISKSTSFLNLFFILFSGIGVLLSSVALKDVFGIKSNFADALCNASSTTDCTSVINSKKWKFFEFISFSDLSFVFFYTQLTAQIVFLIAGNESQFFSIQLFLLWAAIPFIFLSVYYQKFVEKKWCTICLSIILVLVLELAYLVLFYQNAHFPVINSLMLFGIVFFSVLSAWQWAKKTLLKQKQLQEFYIKGKRFSRNYDIFKNTLVAGTKVLFQDNVFELGNKESEKSIAVSTNPFCGYCKDAHFLVEKIFAKHPNTLSIKIILNVDLDMFEDDSKKEFCKKLVSLYLNESPFKFSEALHYWFEHQEINVWNQKYGKTPIAENAEEVLKAHHLWAINNKYQFTPAVFINNYPFPRKYERENLPYFMEEVLEDDNW